MTLSPLSPPATTPKQLRQMTVQFLSQIGFRQRDRLWLRISWSLPLSFLPRFWRQFDRRGTPQPQNYILQGQVTRRGFTLRQCFAAGKDSCGVTRWQARRTRYADGWKLAFRLSSQGATVSFYPNQPRHGVGNHHVSQCPCLFYEMDDRPIADQFLAVKALNQQTGLEPAAIVHSGSKSLHVYFRSTQPLDPETWLRLNRKLAIVQNSDPQICNLARSMRLPGMVRLRVVEGKLTPPAPVALCRVSSATYTPEVMELRLDQPGLFPHGLDDPRWRRWQQLNQQFQSDATIDPLNALLDETSGVLSKPRRNRSHRNQRVVSPLIHPKPRASGAVPLAACLTRADQALVRDGAGQGGRNVQGYKLARNLMGTATFLEEEGVDYKPHDPFRLFEQYCQRCSPAIDSAEADQIWHSATRSRASPSRSPDSILATVEAWGQRIQRGANLRRLLSQLRR
jgi:hypothetical protein